MVLNDNPGAGNNTPPPAGGGTPPPAGGGTPPQASGGVPPTASWRDSLPDDLKSSAPLSLINDIPTLAKSYLHAQSLVGKKGVVAPDPSKATPEEWKAFFKEIGQPDLDKYEIKKGERQLSDDAFKLFKEKAHTLGLLPKQAQELFDWYSDAEATNKGEATKQQKLAQEGELLKLKNEWGAGYDKEVAGAKLFINEILPDFKDHIAKSGLGNDPQFIRMVAKASKLLGEDKLRGAATGGFGMTPAEAQKKIDAVRNDDKHPYFNSSHHGHQAALLEMEGYYKALAASKSA